MLSGKYKCVRSDYKLMLEKGKTYTFINGCCYGKEGHGIYKNLEEFHRRNPDIKIIKE